MTASLRDARLLARSIRFSGDSQIPEVDEDSVGLQHVRGMFSSQGLLIDPAVTPGLAGLMAEVYQQLRMPNEVVAAYVYSSSELQASCLSNSTSECVTTFSSALVNLLDDKELQFVVGHEIGHFLLSHGLVHVDEDDESPEQMMQQRAKEISADRLGLLACDSLDVAVRAMMKTASGLPREQLRFDTTTFLSQLEKPDQIGFSVSESSTHPPWVMRCRALLWFSMSGFMTRDEGDRSEVQLVKLDERIERDLQNYVDGPVRQQIEIAKRNVALWLYVFHAIKDGVFDKSEQQKFAELFDEAMLKKLIGMFDGMGRDDVARRVNDKVRESQRELHQMMPSSYEVELQKISRDIESNFC